MISLNSELVQTIGVNGLVLDQQTTESLYCSVMAEYKKIIS